MSVLGGRSQLAAIEERAEGVRHEALYDQADQPAAAEPTIETRHHRPPALMRRTWRFLAKRIPPLRSFESTRWERHQRALVNRSLDDEDLLRRFGTGEPLPERYGKGLSERVVEFPWVMSQKPRGRVLDAGSALNHRHVLERLLPAVEDLHVVTLAAEDLAFPDLGVSYLFADLRDLPMRDSVYDTVISISTLEHVGMDNSGYGGPAATAANPPQELRKAVNELRRVVIPGGRLLVTVPYGRRESHGWLRQFDRADLDDLVAAVRPTAHSISVYADAGAGWQTSTLEEAAGASYGQEKATAVACLRLAC